MPNWYIDNVMPKVSSGATTVFMIICRQTIGWQKESDTISLSQFMQFTGLTKPTVIKAIKELTAVGVIVVTTENNTSCYTITEPSQNTLPITSKESLPSKKSLPEPVKLFDQEVVKNIDTQKKGKNIGKKSTSATRDVRIDSWQLQTYRELVHLQVPHALRDIVIATVVDPERWRIVITEWIGRGFRPNSITGMLDWYEKGIPNYAQRRTSRQDNGRSRNHSQITAEEWVRQHNEPIRHDGHNE